MDLRPLLRPRHLTLTVLVGLLAGATITAASIDAEPHVPATLSQPVSIPEPREGDRGVYDLWSRSPRDAADEGQLGAPDSTFRFAWGADALRLDGHGQQVWANTLHINHTYLDGDGDQVTQDWTYALRAGTSITFAHDGVYAQSETSEGQGLTPVSASSWSSDQTVTWFGEDARLWSGYPCLRLPFQGGVVGLDASQVDVGGCEWFDHGEQTPDVRVEAVGGQPGQRDVVLLSTTTDLGLPNIRSRMWLREGLPYPIRLEERGGMGQLQALYVLREFEPGTTPLRGVTPVVATLPPLDWAPRTLTGPDDSGLDHPFPLSTAFAAARVADNYTALRDFLGAHPNAYVGWAQTFAYDTPDATQARWQFGVTDGGDVLGVDITRSWPKTLGPLSSILPLAAATDAFAEEPTASLGYEYHPLPPDQLPAKLPTVASLMREWAAYANPDLAPLGATSWSFQLGADPDGAGGFPGLLVAAGHVRQATTTSTPTVFGPALSSDATWTSSEIERRDEFTSVLGLFESISSDRDEEVPLDLAKDVAPPGSPAPAPATSPVRVEARGLFELTPMEQASIGVGALLAASLYWVAPAAKNGVVGLFSRIRDDDLLENPSRRLLRDLVEQTPGIHHQELVRRLGKGKGGAEHHLHKLVDGGLLIGRVSGGYKCYWVPGQATKTAVAAAPALKSPVAQGIVRLRLQQPGISNADMARALAVRPATVHYHVERLRAAGVLTANGYAMPGFVDGQQDSAAAA